VVSELRKQTNVIVVEMHAEATSEKVALGWHLDGRVSIVFGTHTHVPTADATILTNGTAYITDLGMTGPYNSVLGRTKEKVVKSLITGMPNMYSIAEQDPRVAGCWWRWTRGRGRRRRWSKSFWMNGGWSG
jgi:2',3'-cyclic-nucleotide 2'-phosphodiesterase